MCYLNHRCRINYYKYNMMDLNYFVYKCKLCGYMIPKYTYDNMKCKIHKFDYYFGGVYDYNLCFINYNEINIDDVILA